MSLEAGPYDHHYTFGDDLGQRLVIDDKGNVGHTTYTCDGDSVTPVEQRLGTIEGDQIVFTDSDGSETGRADLWQAHEMDPETKEADLDKPLQLFNLDGTTFSPARAQSPCD